MVDNDTHVAAINNAATLAAERLAQAEKAAKSVITEAERAAQSRITTAAAAAVSTLGIASAVQQKDIDYMKAAINRIETKLDNQDTRYVGQTVFAATEKRLDDLEKDVKQCGKDSAPIGDFILWRNILVTAFGGTLGIVIGLLITILTKKL